MDKDNSILSANATKGDFGASYSITIVILVAHDITGDFQLRISGDIS